MHDEMAEKYLEYAQAVDNIFRYIKTYVAVPANVPNCMPTHWIQPISASAEVASLKILSCIPATFFSIIDTRSKGMITLGKPKGHLSQNPDYMEEAS
jgi:hypothetical protein